MLRASEIALSRKSNQDLYRTLSDLRKGAFLHSSRRMSDAAAADYLSIGEIYFLWSRYPAALTSFRRALSLAPSPAPDLRCSILSHIAVVYATVGDFSRSIDFSHQAIKAGVNASPWAQAGASEALGIALSYASNTKDALGPLSAAEESFKSLGDADAEARADLYSGFAYVAMSAVAEAGDKEEEALRLWMSTANVRGTAQANVGLGLLHITTGEPDRALEEYQQALRIFQNIGDQDDEAVVLIGLGGLNVALGDYAKALQYYTRARRIFTVLGDRVGELAAIDAGAKAQWDLGQYVQARSLSELQLVLAQRARNIKEEASALLDVGGFYEHARQYETAENFYQRSLALCLTAKDRFGILDARIALSRLYIQTGRYQPALQSLHRALDLAQSTQYVARESQAHYEMALTHQGLRQFDEAKTEAEAAIRMIESERAKVSDFDSRATYFSSVHAYYQAYIDILMQLHKISPEKDFEKQAFEASEKSKVRSLLDMLSDSGAPSECLAASQSVASEVKPDQKNDSCGNSTSKALTLEQVQDEIRDDDAVLLEYALGPELSELWALADGKIFSYILPSEAEITKLAAAYHAALTARQPLANEDGVHYLNRMADADARLPDLADKLSRILLGPASGLLQRRRVIIVPDGCLRYVPFAALPVTSSAGESTGSPLAANHEIVSLPSASILAALRQAAARRPQPAETAAVFADPVFSRDDPRLSGHNFQARSRTGASTAFGMALRDTGFGAAGIPRLPASRTEAEKISEAFSSKNVFLALDFDANRRSILNGSLDRYRYIHFATHGLLDSRNPEFSGLILSLFNEDGQRQDGYLRVKDIYSLKLTAELVVLSSCNSSLGKDLQSEGIFGLPRAFLYAGAKRVISTLWKIDDNASAQLMGDFYARLRNGESPSAALRSAQMSLAAADPSWGHPYYWAAFVLQGEDR